MPSERSRVLFFGLLAFWLVFPLVLGGRFAQDAIPYVVAGEMLTTQPDAVYAAEGGDLFTLEPPFAERSRQLSPPDVDNVAFVSTPPTLPFAYLVARLGSFGGVLAMRLLGCACLAGGMLALWHRLAPRARHAGAHLAATALALTPFVMVPTALGQTSPVLFASAAVGVAATVDRRLRAILVAGLWVAAVALKFFPAALVLVLLLQRRWKVVGWSALWGLALGLVTLAVVPAATISEFLGLSGQLSETADFNPYNGSIDALVYALSPAATQGPAAVGLLVLRGLAAVGAWWWVSRRADDDTAWAYGYLVLLLLVPLVWWHYLWLAIAALAMALASRPRIGRELIVLPVAAALTIPMSLVNGFGTSWPAVQAVFLVAAVVAVPVVLRLPVRPVARRPTGTAGLSERPASPQ